MSGPLVCGLVVLGAAVLIAVNEALHAFADWLTRGEDRDETGEWGRFAGGEWR